MTVKQQKTISSKLWLLSFGLLFNLLIIAGLSLWTSGRLTKELNLSMDVLLPAVRNMTLIDMMHDGIRGSVFYSIIISGTTDKASIDEARRDGLELIDNMKAYVDNLKKLDLPPEIRAAIDPMIPTLLSYEDLAISITNLALDGRLDEAKSQLPEFQDQFENLEVLLIKLGDQISTAAQVASDEGHKLVNYAELTNKIVVAIGVIFGLFFCWLIIRKLQKSMTYVIHELSSEAQTVTQSARQLSSTAQNLSASSSQQASALQETAASVDEITAMVKKTSDNAKQLEVAAGQSHQSASKGQEAISQMLSAMDTISDSNVRIMSQVEGGNQKIAEVVRVISEIGMKTKVINEIVFQTKLLSFNASVEAARAGEHGKGFAVVAEEVGNLAQMSGNAAKEIADMLSSSIAKVQGIVNDNKRSIENLIHEGKENISTGVIVARQCGNSLQEIVRYSSDVNSMISEITTAIQEQNLGIQEISKAIQLLDQSTHENSATSQRTSQTSVSLLNQSQALEEIVRTLEQMVSQKTGSNQDKSKPGNSQHLPAAQPVSLSNVISVQSSAAISLESNSNSPNNLQRQYPRAS